VTRQVQDVDTGQPTDLLVEALNASLRALALGEGFNDPAFITATGDIDPGTEVHLVDATAGAVVLTLPLCAAFTRRRLVVRHTVGAHNVTLNPQPAEQIDTGGAGVGLSLNSLLDTAELITDQTTWFRIR
jgi:hypothetical protein